VDNIAVSVGYNTFQLGSTVNGSTNEVGFVKDDLLAVPTLTMFEVAARLGTLGTPLYISGVPYFNTGGSVIIGNITVSDWIGHTYLDTNSPLQVSQGSILEGAGTAITTQGFPYTALDGAPSFLTNGIPNVDAGRAMYTIGDITVPIDGTAASSSKLAIQMTNVNGSSAIAFVSTIINTFSAPLYGLEELNIPVSSTLGGTFTDNGLRIRIGNGAAPAFTAATNYYVSNVFAGNITVEGTDEAIVRFGTLTHNETNFSTYLPHGPNLSNRPGTQYFTFAFRRSIVANFTVNYTGQISGLYIAAPGTVIDSASSMNGWLDGTIVYAGAGVPGDIVAFGNGSLGCAKTAGDVIPVGSPVTNGAYTMTLGSANSSDATGNQIFVCIGLTAGDSLTSISIS
jgi:hypothetical protein